ncbi:hypothetical protein WJX74_009298 [Apatococcus lobatus]|uniref:Uncharacterized protein n=1 Tax=Apatococcus lobatus TaxID=904363 RepID=A0AAW1RU08_9CHLO
MKHAIKHEHPVLDIFEVTGKTNKADLSSEIRKTGQRGLQALFKKVYGAPTKSNNNCWLRRKLLQAAGGKQLSPAQTRSSPSRDHRIEVVERSVLRSPGEQDDAMASSSEYSEHSAASQQGFDSLPSPTNSVGDCRNYQADPAGELYNMARFQLTQVVRSAVTCRLFAAPRLQTPFWIVEPDAVKILKQVTRLVAVVAAEFDVS